MVMHEFCPEHLFAWMECSSSCGDEREEFQLAAQSMRMYWSDWRHDRLMRTTLAKWHTRLGTVRQLMAEAAA